MIKTKIVCTIGPATDSPEKIKELIETGMNVARLNFSHGSIGYHREKIRLIRRVAQECKTNIGILFDIKGPEVRISEELAEPLEVLAGERVWISYQNHHLGKWLPVDYADFWQDVKVGCFILLDDGRFKIRVIDVGAGWVEGEMLNQGFIYPGKSVNLPGLDYMMPYLSKIDIQGIKMALKQDVDFIAASFVRNCQDLENIEALFSNQEDKPDLIAKIESASALKNLASIIDKADGVMIARGDLGVEISLAEVPLIQKKIVKYCNRVGKPVITATQMLESMIENPRPTRAEASDIANAIFDGSDALMLSGETAKGNYPLESLETMIGIIKSAENVLSSYYHFPLIENTGSKTDAISQGAKNIAESLQVDLMVMPTVTGTTARMVSRFRSLIPMIAITRKLSTWRKLSLVWGAKAVFLEGPMVGVIEDAIVSLQKQKLVKTGDVIVITAGIPSGEAGSTNLIKVHQIE